MNKITILDGAMGTMLQKSGLPLGSCPEALSITNPDLITDIHKMYIGSGSDIIYTNTFGANEYKLEGSGYSVEEIIPASVAAAKQATVGTSAKVALDIGPTGMLLEPLGTLSFEKAYDMFARQMKAGAEADLIVIETMTDLLEVKAAVLAAKENTNLPVYVTMTFEENGRTFTGCSAESMAATLEGLGVDAIGLNCSLGPNQVYTIAKKLCENTSLPVIVKPNAGLPRPDGSGYDIDEKGFADAMEKILALGVSIVGGCCGTTPDYIKALADMAKTKAPAERKLTPVSCVCSASACVKIDGVKVIGERINPTGKKLFKQALINNDMNYILNQALSQAQAGAHILDVNVGLPEIDEKEMMVKTVKALQSITDLPLQIDSSNPDVIEAALRIYNSKAIVNSVNGEDKSLHTVLPIVKKYGAAVVGLTLDEKGIPALAEERVAIAEKIVNTALSYGIKREDIYIDCLTLTASAEQDKVEETLKAVEMVKEKFGVHTVLGVSNISFGLPNRELINKTFLALALGRGLDLPIINPNVQEMMNIINAFNVLSNSDKNAENYIGQYSVETQEKPVVNNEVDITYAIEKGLADEAKQAAKKLLETEDAMTVINERLIPALDKVGDNFEKGIIFLPQLIQSATAAQSAFDAVRMSFGNESAQDKGTIVIATVKGDVHDIGKNIVKTILANYGYRIVDLGKNVDPKDVADAAIKEKAALVGLSALMTTTLGAMEETISLLREKTICKIMVGGAVLTEDYAKAIGADYYAKDAKQGADIAKEVFGK